ncbi:MAG TPA: hypothetical protein VHO67_18170 [Polyangia bacterium]|nr:hypothetical protein [Polyangia bacterium]
MTATGGNNATGGSNASGGRGGSNPTGGSTGNGGGSPGSGGSGTGSGGSGAGGSSGTGTDMGGVALAKACDSVSASKAYLNLGDMRLLNNRWGSDALNCGGSMYKVMVNCDNTLGYSFSRPVCGGSRGDPDFPEVEFGVAPFGANSSLLTSPKFSSTTLLPAQIKTINSASVTITSLAATFTSPSYYDTNFEFWISKDNPLTSSNPQVYAEIIIFLDWEANRQNGSSGGWSCDASGSISSGGNTFNLCHQKDDWSSGHWRFFNFVLSNGPSSNFTGKGDVKAILDWVMNKYSGFSTDFWLTRIEVGTEVDDSTAGQVKLQNVAFEINGTTKTPQLAK